MREDTQTPGPHISGHHAHSAIDRLIAVRVRAEVDLTVLLCQVLSPPQTFAATAAVDELTPLVLAEARNWAASVDH